MCVFFLSFYLFAVCIECGWKQEEEGAKISITDFKIYSYLRYLATVMFNYITFDIFVFDLSVVVVFCILLLLFRCEICRGCNIWADMPHLESGDVRNYLRFAFSTRKRVQ